MTVWLKMLYHKKEGNLLIGVISWLLIRRLIQLHKEKFFSVQTKIKSICHSCFPIVFRKFSSVRIHCQLLHYSELYFLLIKTSSDELCWKRTPFAGSFQKRENREAFCHWWGRKSKFSSFLTLQLFIRKEYNVYTILSKTESICDMCS